MMNFLNIHANVNKSILYDSQIYQQLFLQLLIYQHLPTKVIANVLGNNVILIKKKKRLVIISVYALIES